MEEKKIRKQSEEQQELNIFQMYLDEVAAIDVCTDAENEQLAVRAKAGDTQALSRLIEGNLKYVLGLTRDFLASGVAAGDLVQEANMALVMAADAFAQAEDAADFRTFLDGEVKTALEAAVAEQTSEAKVEEKMVARVNVLKDVSQEMAEELGREATVEELAERMQMTADDIREIMKLTLDAMSVNGEEYADDGSGSQN